MSLEMVSVNPLRTCSPERTRLTALVAVALWLGMISAATAAHELVQLRRVPNAGLQPQVAVDPQGNVHLVYLHGDPKGCDVFYSVRKAGRPDFSDPVTVNSEPGSAIAIGTVRGAQLALGRNGFVHVAWNGSQPAREPGAKGSPMLYSRMKPGSHFEPQRNLMTATMNLDGGGSVAADAQGNVYVVWHAHLKTGPDDEVHRAVYVAQSADDGAVFAPERKVNSDERGVCGCCGLKAFADPQGDLAILYRTADDVGNRDSFMLVSRDRGVSFESLPLGAWRSSTCPMSTPALGPTQDQRLLAMWETQGQVYWRSIAPRSLVSSPPASAAERNPGNRKHPVFALSRGKEPHLLLAWVEGTGWEKGGAVAWECIDLTNGSKTTGREAGVPPWGMTSAFANPDGTFTLLY